MTAVNEDSFTVQPAGMLEVVEVDWTEVKRCRGAGVLIPGPVKQVQRCHDKITSDYEGKEPWPPAASLCDIVRCAVVLDDPYAMAVFVAYLEKTFDVVRIKNRFEQDEVEEVTAEQIHAEFYGADTQGEDTETQSNSTAYSDSSNKRTTEKMYRDILINIRPKGTDIICELQITLTGIAILKKSEQKVYSILRMVAAEELLQTYVFSRQPFSLGRSVSTTSDSIKPGRVFTFEQNGQRNEYIA